MTSGEAVEDLVCISCVDEVRYSFVSYLSTALRRKGIDDVVMDVDSDDLLSKESQAKVEKARVSVMVLPGNCEPTKVYLDKFVKVLECHRNNKDHVVVPVLYGDCPLQGGEWLNVLDLSGLSPIHQSRRECSDSKLVQEIVKDVYEKLFYMGRTGIYSKLVDIEYMVNKQPIGIRHVGIWGMPGIGKTTLAKAVFDQMSGEFETCCFVEDYEKNIHEMGLYGLLDEQLMKESTAEELNSNKVLVVLDDVRNALVAESFLEEFDWFGPESLIIITSRDKQVFRLCQISQIYEVQGLNENEALQVFMLCASIKEMGEQNLRELSREVIKYADGNPLALSIYGRELKGERGPSEMVTAFLQLIQYPPLEIVHAIKGSYETLSNREKNIFLDIACFFSGENVDCVMQLLEGCGFFPHVGIDVLVDKCMVSISNNQVRMHNMIQNFGRELVNGEAAEIERGSRLWEPCSIRNVLEDNGQKENCVQGTEEIEGMFLDTSNLSFDVKPAAFENMPNLRLLKIYCSKPEIHPVNSLINIKDSLYSLPNELRLLHWENYPLEYFPQNFEPRHLVEINMPYSQLRKLWGGTVNLEMLRTIRLCHSQQLVNIDDLQNAQNLEVIDLQACTKLQSFPATGEMLHLRVLNLSGCTEIESLSDIPPNIEMLHLQGTGIIELPLSIVKPNYSEILNLAKIQGLAGVSDLESDLKSLTNMKMSTCRLNLGKLNCLELKNCSRLQSLPDMVNLDLLRVLDLSDCSELQTIQGFPRNLKELNIAGTAVRQVPQLPQSLELFNAHGCVLLQSIRLDVKKLPVYYTFSNCFDLPLEVLNDFLVKALANVKHLPREPEQELNEAPAFSFFAPSHRNLNSTLHLVPGSSVVTQLDTSLRNSLVGFAMLVEVTFSEDYCDDTGFDIICICRWRNKEGHFHRIERNLHCWAPGKAVPKVQNNHILFVVDFNIRPGTNEENVPNIWGDLVVFEFFLVNKQKKPLDDSCRVTRCGVRVINAASGNTSLENTLPVLSMDPMEVSDYEVEDAFSFSVKYDGLQERDKVLFLYIACLFNDEDVSFVTPLIASNIDLDVSSGLKVLMARYLISLSSNGEIVMHSFQRQMAKKLLHGQSLERLVDNIQSSVLTQSKNPRNWTRNLADVPEKKSSLMATSSSVVRPTSMGPQVYICFHRPDVRKHFVSFLYHALRVANINVFRDGVVLGSNLAISLSKSIEESDIALVIFSEDFTSSSWCLDELVKIKELKDQGRLKLIPIFYKVHPWVVSNLEGRFGDNFRTLKRKSQQDLLRTKNWKEALRSIKRIQGFMLSENSDKSHTDFIESVVDKVKSLVNDIEMEENVDEIREEINSQCSSKIVITHSDNPKTWTGSSTEEPPKKCSTEMGTASSQAGHSRLQVFINYRRKELRHTFIKHLLSELNRKHINYYIYKNTEKGKPLTDRFKKIQESAIALAIFSKRYAELTCLDELLKMKERVKAGELMVIPVYVNVTPTEVKKFNGEFGKGFKEMIERHAIKPDKVNKWKEAVCYIADIGGLIWNDGNPIYLFSHPSDFTDKNLAMRAAMAVRKELLKRNPNYGKTEKNWLVEFYSSFILALFFGNVIPRLAFADGKLRLAASWLVALLVFYMTYNL